MVGCLPPLLQPGFARLRAARLGRARLGRCARGGVRSHKGRRARGWGRATPICHSSGSEPPRAANELESERWPAAARAAAAGRPARRNRARRRCPASTLPVHMLDHRRDHDRPCQHGVHPAPCARHSPAVPPLHSTPCTHTLRLVSSSPLPVAKLIGQRPYVRAQRHRAVARDPQ
jgi:hypothetical protein